MLLRREYKWECTLENGRLLRDKYKFHLFIPKSTFFYYSKVIKGYSIDLYSDGRVSIGEWDFNGLPIKGGKLGMKILVLRLLLKGVIS